MLAISGSYLKDTGWSLQSEGGMQEGEANSFSIFAPLSHTGQKRWGGGGGGDFWEASRPKTSVRRGPVASLLFPGLCTRPELVSSGLVSRRPGKADGPTETWRTRSGKARLGRKSL